MQCLNCGGPATRKDCDRHSCDEHFKVTIEKQRLENEALKKELEAVKRENEMLKREMGSGKTV